MTGWRIAGDGAIKSKAQSTRPRFEEAERNMAEQTNNAVDQPQLKQRIEVEWDDKTYYGAVVQNYRLNDEGSYEWFLKYDDGDSEWLTFDGTVKWRLSASELKEPARLAMRRNPSRRGRVAGKHRAAGSAGIVDPNDILPVRTEVEVKYKMEGGTEEYFGGVITKVHEEEDEYDVRFHDGDMARRIERADISLPVRGPSTPRRRR